MFRSIFTGLSVVLMTLWFAVGCSSDDGMSDECLRIVYDNSPEVMEFDQAFPESMLGAGAVQELQLVHYPNPENTEMIIEYTLPVRGKVTLAVYDASGKLLKTLLENTPKTPGFHGVLWDGKNALGSPVSQDVYVELKTAGKSIVLNI